MPRRGARPWSVFVASLGLIIILTNLLVIVFGNQARALEVSALDGAFQAGQMTLTKVGLVTLTAALLILAGLLVMQRRTRAGKLMRAVGSNREMAALIGTRTGRVEVFAYVLGSALVVPPALLNSVRAGVDYSQGHTIILMATLAVIAGGVGSITGAALGGWIIGMVHSMSDLFLPISWGNGVVFGVMLIFIVARPTGIFGKTVWKSGI